MKCPSPPDDGAFGASETRDREHDPWLTLREGAAYARVHGRTLTRAMRRGSLTGYRVSGRLWRFRRSAIDAWIAGEPS